MFFRGLGHVGMYVGNGKMLHSPRTGERVRIDKLSSWRKASFVGAVRPGL
jgi:cell wall-associated NlpC family hydrolase